MVNEAAEQQLAINGGAKAVPAIEGKEQEKIGFEEFMSVAERFGLTPETLAEVRAAVEKMDWGTGPFLVNYYSGMDESKVQEYERKARELFNSPYAIGTSSGTGALHSAFVAAGVRPGKEVICPAIGFYATAAAVVMAGGTPVFCDVDESMMMDADCLKPLVNDRTVACAPTHVMGAVCNMPKIVETARELNIKVVEDCAQSCGGKVNGQYIGTFGDFGCFSISAYKRIGGGEGGLVLTKTERDWDAVNGTVEGSGLWRPERFALPRYEGELIVGGNYRMSELEACVDSVQLDKAKDVVSRFNHANRRIANQLESFNEITPQLINDPEGILGYLFRFYPSSIELGEKLVAALQAEGIGANSRLGSDKPDWHIYRYMYPLKEDFNCGCYSGDAKRTYEKGACPVADDLFDRVVSFKVSQWYTDADCDNIAKGVNKVLNAYCTKNDNPTKSW